MHLSNSFTNRSAVQDDAPEVAGLLNAHSTSVIGRPTWDADMVETEFASPGVGLAQDTQVIAAADGHVAGFVMVVNRAPYVSALAIGAVDPSHVGKGLGGALAGWSEDRVRRSIGLTPPGTQVTIRQEIWAEHARALGLLHGRGYRPVRYFTQMQIGLEPALARPVVAGGITIRAFRGIEELRPLATAVDGAFRDHWGYVDRPFDEVLKRWEGWIDPSKRYDPRQWILATEGDQIVGAAIADGAMEEDDQMAYISTIAVLREWRGRGIGTALLLSLLAVLRRLGFERAALDVDADSLTGATRLYERVGFLPARQSIDMEMELRPGRDLRTQEAEAQVAGT